MKILFCRIAHMKYYKGIKEYKDEPKNGGKYVEETGDAHEKYNFKERFIDGENVCLGFFETKSTNGEYSNQVHIEKIKGCKKSDNIIDNVLVIWCATAYENEFMIVGWYKNATVYRYYEEHKFDDDYIQSYNVKANSKDCFLIPADGSRRSWKVATKKRMKTYGFGSRPPVWYANEEESENYIEDLIKRIENYNDGNWLNYTPNIKE